MNQSLGILFDYNGVIANDEPLQQEAITEAVKKYGVKLTPEKYVEYCLGRSDLSQTQNLQIAFPDELGSVDPMQLVQEKGELYQEISKDEVTILPEVVEQVRKLADKIKIAIVTGSAAAEVKPMLEKVGILNLFQFILSADDISRSKPDPEGYTKGLTSLGTLPHNTIVVEDTNPGIQAAHSAGLKCIALSGTHAPNELAAADAVVSSFPNLEITFIQHVLKE